MSMIDPAMTEPLQRLYVWVLALLIVSGIFEFIRVALQRVSDLDSTYQYNSTTTMTNNNHPTFSDDYEQSLEETSDSDLPPGFEADFDLEDTKQETGIQKIEVEGLGHAAVQLVDFEAIYNLQQQQQHSPGNRGGGRNESAVFDLDMIAYILRTHYVEPSMDGLTGEDVGAMKPALPGNLLDGVTGEDISVDMQGDQAELSVGNNESESEAEGNTA